MVKELPYRVAKRTAIRVEEGDMVQTRVPMWRRGSSSTLPRVQAYVMVVAPAERKAAPGTLRSGP
jgi:hypothetical protein